MNAMVNLEAIAKESKQRLACPSYRVLVCDGTGCVASGSRLVHQRFLSDAQGLDGLVEV